MELYPKHPNECRGELALQTTSQFTLNVSLSRSPIFIISPHYDPLAFQATSTGHCLSGSYFSNTMMLTVERCSILGKERDDEVRGVLAEVFDERRDPVGVERLQ